MYESAFGQSTFQRQIERIAERAELRKPHEATAPEGHYQPVPEKPKSAALLAALEDIKAKFGAKHA